MGPGFCQLMLNQRLLAHLLGRASRARSLYESDFRELLETSEVSPQSPQYQGPLCLLHYWGLGALGCARYIEGSEKSVAESASKACLGLESRLCCSQPLICSGWCLSPGDIGVLMR